MRILNLVAAGLVASGITIPSVANASQRVYADCGSETISVYYDASDDGLSGLGLRVHWDSTQGSIVGFRDVLKQGFFASQGPIPDTHDYDQDPGTDFYHLFAWVDWASDPTWPGQKLPALLVAIDHESLRTIGFSASSKAVGHNFGATGCLPMAG